MYSVSCSRVIISTILCLAALSVNAENPSNGLVKKSNSDLCHTTDSPYYHQIKHFKQYPSLRACLESGAVTWDDKRGLPDKTLPYHRARFGSGWEETDTHCMDIRNKILIDLSLVPVTFEPNNECQIERGRWYDFYSGIEIYQAKLVDIDHVVPLKWAWDRGAKTWSYDKRVEFANDLSNLVISSQRTNRSKTDKGISQWLPNINQCQYILRFIRISRKYRLEPTNSEKRQHNLLQDKYCSQN